MNIIKWIFRIVGLLIGLAILGILIWVGIKFGQQIGLIK